MRFFGYVSSLSLCISINFSCCYNKLSLHTNKIVLIKYNTNTRIQQNMPTDASRCLHSHSKFDYGFQGVILTGNITSITAPWSNMLTSNVDLWEIVTSEGMGCGIVATEDLSKGTRCGARQCGTKCYPYNPSLGLFCGTCLHTTSDDDQTRPEHTTQIHSKHHHHGG